MKLKLMPLNPEFTFGIARGDGVFKDDDSGNCTSLGTGQKFREQYDKRP